jgi:hypothetical protein
MEDMMKNDQSSVDTAGAQRALEEKLLAIGGQEVLRMPDPHIDDVVARGEVFDGRRAKKLKGDAHRCHQNVVLQHLLSRGRLPICTGYAMSHDGLWCQHSWLLDGERVVEATTPMRSYFGIRLDPVSTLMFVWAEVISMLPGARDIVQRKVTAA